MNVKGLAYPIEELRKDQGESPDFRGEFIEIVPIQQDILWYFSYEHCF